MRAVYALCAAIALAACMVIALTLSQSKRPDSVPVVIPVEAPGLDGAATRIPLRIRGTDDAGNYIDRVVYVDGDGSGAELPLGAYTVGAEGSPISAAGGLYEVPEATMEFTLDGDAVAEGKTGEAEKALAFSPADPLEVTEEQVEKARRLARGDPARAGLADGLADLALELHDEALTRAEEEAVAKAKTAEDEKYTFDLSFCEFVMPGPWRGVVELESDEYYHSLRLADSDTHTAPLYIYAPDDSYDYDIWNRPEVETSTLENGRTLELIPWDDHSMMARLRDGEGNCACLVTHVCFDRESLVGPMVHGYLFEGAEEYDAYLAAQKLLSDADDPTQLAKDVLRVCAEGVVFEEEASSDDGMTDEDPMAEPSAEEGERGDRPTVDSAAIDEFERRRMLIEDGFDSDPRLAGTMADMYAAGVEREERLETLMGDIYAFLDALPQVDSDELRASQDRWRTELESAQAAVAGGYSEGGSGNMYGMDATSTAADALNARIDELLALAHGL